jgi:iron-sulfur cluster assembly protein|tara:strand:+ start:5028 stop:5354 length:327 start_codon:yes stop_codon:yes gene_type:complete
MIDITNTAKKEITNLLVEETTKDGLRIAVRGGGCSGFQYDLKFISEDEATNMDQEFVINDVRVFIDPKSSLYLDGVVLNYEDGLMGSGFRIENPNAKTTCGCGESFSV